MNLASDMAVKMKKWVADPDPIFLFGATSCYHGFLSISILHQLGFQVPTES